MYHTPYFKAKNNEEVIAFMHAHPFVMLCGVSAKGEPVATHVPVLIEERNNKLYLLAHTMRKQAHTEAFLHQPQVLAIFYGAHSYVSASWYTHPQTASTWNYQAVHAKGSIAELSEERLYTLLVKLTDTFENNPESNALVKHIEPGAMLKMMKAIIGFEIEVTAIEHVFKLSQNRDKESYKNIIDKLQTGDDGAKEIAAIMKAGEPKNI